MLNLAILTGTHPAAPTNQLLLIVSPDPATSEMLSVVPIGVPRAVVFDVPATDVRQVDSFTLIPLAREKFAAEVFRMVQHASFQKGLEWVAKNRKDEASGIGTSLFAAFKHLLPPDVLEMVEMMGPGE